MARSAGGGGVKLGQKEKTVYIVALLARGSRLTINQLSERAGMAPEHIRSTLHLLRKHGLVEFAGWGAKKVKQGCAPAMWGWK